MYTYTHVVSSLLFLVSKVLHIIIQFKNTIHFTLDGTALSSLVGDSALSSSSLLGDSSSGTLSPNVWLPYLLNFTTPSNYSCKINSLIMLFP